MYKRMKLPVIALLLLFAASALLLGACGAPAPTENAASASPSAQLELTAEELAAYNGQNGQPAYIAVDGVIYDVTNVPQWKNGGHNGFSAGKDLTNEIKTVSPHGVSKLKGLPVVGKLK